MYKRMGFSEKEVSGILFLVSVAYPEIHPEILPVILPTFSPAFSADGVHSVPRVAPSLS
ncbi:MAG: hypothetical protein ACLR0U_00305 [Enterocloster clostridioformis]